MEDYKAYLRALVQRYDTNHPDHAPGLRYPVEYWEIEAEWGTGFWQGSLEEYLELLRVAYSTIKQANPRAKVILIGSSWQECLRDILIRRIFPPPWRPCRHRGVVLANGTWPR
jgi:hypothetical protein